MSPEPKEPVALGLPPAEVSSPWMTDVFQEMVNKLAWALGSTYRKPYSNKSSSTRKYAIKMATRAIKDNGYPEHIAKK